MSLLDLNADPGEGNVNVRAYIASLLGPRRVAHGSRKTVKLSSSQAVKVGQNGARDHEAVYLQCWIPAGALPGLGGAGALVLFSDTEDMGNGQLVNMATGFPGQPNSSYSAVLLPQDELYAQVFSDAAFGVLATLPVVVSQVTF